MRSELECDRLTTVAVWPSTALSERRRLFGALEGGFPIVFRSAEDWTPEVEAILAFGNDGGTSLAKQNAQSMIPAMAFPAGHWGRDRVERITLGDCKPVDPRVRGIGVRGQVGPPGAAPIPGQILATSPSGPVWTLDPGPIPLHRVSSPLPELDPSQTLLGLYLQSPMALIALVHFLRALTSRSSFSPPALRAAFLFDDPNLRWRTYGFIDYRQLVEHADAHGYHAAMAMIPIDSWGQHRGTVDLFRKRRDRLSVVRHGNNHVAQELMRSQDLSGALAVAAQAMRRTARIEARHGLAIDRIMVPPHGMCSASMAQALGILGFDALCAIHPLPWTEHPPSEQSLAGWGPAEFAADCAVIPRIPLTSPSTEIALRAYLDQPLVLYGHHDDLADGLDLLAEAAAHVNRLGPVNWSSVGEIALTNHATRIEGGRLLVRPYSRRLRLDMPLGTKALLVEKPRETTPGLVGWSVDTSPPLSFGCATSASPAPLEIRLRGASEIDPAQVKPPAWRPWPVLRRVATEARDRTLPLRPTGAA
jgi:hypothetical protein